MIELLAIIAITLASLPLSLLVLRGERGLYFALPLSTLGATLAAYLHIILDFSIVLFWLVLIVLPSIIVVLLPRSRAIIAESAVEIWKIPQSFARAITFLVFCLVAFVTTPAPLLWDARSIWFHHASWLNGPALFFREAQFLPAGAWPDYPFAGPALMTLSWQISFVTENLWLASQIMGLLFISLVALIFTTLLRAREDNLPLAVSTIAMVIFLSSSILVSDGWYNTGYQDAFQAASVALILALGLTKPSGPLVQHLSLIFAAYFLAANIKQEGFWFATGTILVVVLVQVIRGRYLYSSLLVGIPITRTVWTLFSDWLGMPENSHTSEVIGRLGELFDLQSEAWMSISSIWQQSVQPRSLGYIAIAIVASLVVLAAKSVSWREKLSASLAISVTPVGLLFVAIITYALGEAFDLSWWLGTSYTRITATFELLVLTGAMLSFVYLFPWSEKKRIPAKKIANRKR